MSGKTRENRTEASFWSLLWRLTPMVLRASPFWVTLNFSVGIIHSLSYGFQIIVTRAFFDAIAAVGAETGIAALVGPAVASGLVLVASQVLNGVHNFMYMPLMEKVKGELRKTISRKSSRIEPVEFENPAFLDDVNKAKQGADSAIMVPLNFAMIFIFYVPYFAVFAGFYYTLKPELVLSLVIVFIPTFIMQLVRGRYYAKLEEKSAPIRRRFEYAEKAITDREFFKETRLLGAFGLLFRMYGDAVTLLNAHTWKTEKKTVLIESGLRALSLIGYMAILAMLFNFLRAGEISVGSFAAVFASIGSLFGVMEEIVVRHIGGMSNNLGKIRNFVRFLDIPERTAGKGRPEGGGIELRGVTFRYPGKEEDTIRGISLTVRPGETVAIVGGNGAGKTTLMRLISGIYLPREGEIAIGGVRTGDISPSTLYEGFSAVFQKFQKYRMTLKDNVLVSSEKDGDAARSLALADVDVTSESFPVGLDTMLSREFEGVDISGGQWQRVAIARGYHRDHTIILLDEPTAAIDPIEESKIYRQFADISRGKTAVIVTHRMGSAKIADRIVVMENGRINDIGTHDELVARGGLYATMWDAQAQWYEA